MMRYHFVLFELAKFLIIPNFDKFMVGLIPLILVDSSVNGTKKCK